MSTIKVNTITNNGSAVDLPSGAFSIGGKSIVQNYTSSATEPTSPSAGDIWWDSANSTYYVYINGGFKEIGALGSTLRLTANDTTVTNYVSGNSFYLYYSPSYETYHKLDILANCTLTFNIWGGAGGTGTYQTNSLYAGCGGLTYGSYSATAGETLYVYVGSGGWSGLKGGYGGLGGWPNGGYGTMGDATGSGGGGMTMISNDLYANITSANYSSKVLLIAGAGGGATGFSSSAGDGGGSSGGTTSAAGASNGIGGSQVAGGATAGAFFQGGSHPSGSRTVSSSYDDGGGGGGLYGGGSGDGDGQPAGGGSGYVNTSLITGGQTVITSTAGTAPDSNSLLLSGYATGISSINALTPTTRAQDGLVHIAIS